MTATPRDTPVPSRRPPVALVTGGGKGAGAAIAYALARDGMRVAVLGRDRAALEQTATACGGLAVVADVTDAGAVDGALTEIREKWGSISVRPQRRDRDERAAADDGR
jgi:NADP-dependent 3-hydroxy acid dehydrogenase YdfG